MRENQTNDLKSFRGVVLVIFVVGLLLRLWIAWRPLPTIDNLLFPDDTYISMAIARNMALGRGMTFDGLAITNGFQPLYVFLLVPLFKLIPNQLDLPIHIALTGLALLNMATAYFLMKILLRLIGQVAALFGLLIWVFSPIVIREGINGLETGMAVFWMALATAVYVRAIGASLTERKQAILLGFVTGLAMFTRVDNVIFVGAVGLALLLRGGRLNRHNFINALLMGMTVVVVMLPWFVISYQCCGALLPESGGAVRFQALASFHDIPGGAFTLLLYNFFVTLRILARSPMELDHTIIWSFGFALLGLSVVTSYGRSLWRRLGHKVKQTEWIRRLWPIWLFIVLLLMAYNTYILAYWFFVRYFYPVTWVMTIVWASILTGAAVYISKRWQKPLWQISLFMGVILVFWFLPGLSKLLFSTPKQGGYYNIAIWANETLPENTVLGSAQTGALTYWARPDLTVINMDGVANPDAYAALESGEQMKYLREQGITYIVNWPINMDLLRDYGGEPLDTTIEPLGKTGVFTIEQEWEWYHVLPKEGDES